MHRVLEHPREPLSESEIAFLTQLARGNALTGTRQKPERPASLNISPTPSPADVSGPLQALLSLLRRRLGW